MTILPDEVTKGYLLLECGGRHRKIMRPVAWMRWRMCVGRISIVRSVIRQPRLQDLGSVALVRHVGVLDHVE